MQQIIAAELHSLADDELARLLPARRAPGEPAYERRRELMRRHARAEEVARALGYAAQERAAALVGAAAAAERREVAYELEALGLLADAAAGPHFAGEALARRLVPLEHAAAALSDEGSVDALRLPLLRLVCVAYLDVEVRSAAIPSTSPVSSTWCALVRPPRRWPSTGCFTPPRCARCSSPSRSA